MKNNNEKSIKKLTSKVLKETLESKVKNIEEKLGGMDDDHPRFGKKRLPIKMSKDEIDAMFNEPISSDDEEIEFEFDDKDENDNLNEIGQMPYFPSHDDEDEEEEEEEKKKICVNNVEAK
jgi:hypothetical protein